MLASDHAGFPLKQSIATYLKEKGATILDLGTNSTDSVDYPDFAQAAAKAILQHKAGWGIVICGTGIGISIAANRFKGIRCALCCNAETAILARQHNNANLLALSGRMGDTNEAIAMVQAFAETPYEGGRHEKRLIKIDETQ